MGSLVISVLLPTFGDRLFVIHDAHDPLAARVQVNMSHLDALVTAALMTIECLEKFDLCLEQAEGEWAKQAYVGLHKVGLTVLKIAQSRKSHRSNLHAEEGTE